MALLPRVVLVHRRTEFEDLLARHGTRGQAAFYLGTRGRELAEVEARHAKQAAALASVAAAVPADWRRGSVERADLSRFLFAPEDVVVIVGQDGLVANTAKYLDGQPVIGINPDPARNPGVLVPHAPPAAAGLLGAAVARGGDRFTEPRTMVEITTDDGQRLRALNEIYLGSATHQTARYELRSSDGPAEAQASSGVLIGTGTGATGWCRSAWLERHSALPLPSPTAAELIWFVREAWPSPASGTSHTEGRCGATGGLSVLVQSDRLVAFGDGVEADALQLAFGQTVTVRVADQRLQLLR